MTHVMELASSARSKCRGCGQRIDKGVLRFGERLPNPFAEGDMTHWFHPRCAAYKRPEALAEIIDDSDQPDDELASQKAAIESSMEFRRLSRIDGVERAPSGRARCRSCRETIAKDEWRIPLVFYEEGMFNPSGSIHIKCSKDYFDTTDIVDRLTHFGTALEVADIEDIKQQLADLPT
jgi:hypothetical protein